MFEYKIRNLSEEKILELECFEIYPIENIFPGERYFSLFGDENTEKILMELNISFEKNNVNSTGWEDKWKEYLKPGKLTKNLSYVFEPYQKDEKSIYINPAMAFGTGTHSTTQIAANLLEDIVAGKKVIDVGCGSGILSVAAEILGASQIVAIDIDSMAMLNAKENIEANNCKNIYFWSGELSSVNLSFKPDIVCANIISSVLLKIKDDIFNFNPKYVVVSGILIKEFEKFKSEFIPCDYKILKYLEQTEWCGTLLKKIK